jgi:hypothetical protein
MNRESNPVRQSSPPSAPARSSPGPNFGALLHSHRYTATAYFVAAAVMFSLPQIVALYATLTGPAQPISFLLTVFGITFFWGALGSALFIVKGRRRHGRIVEFYEHGLRFVTPQGADAMFLFAEVKELKRRTIRGDLANLTFVLTDGRTYTVDVDNRKTAAVLGDVLARFGPIRWEADRGFRLF